VIDLSPAVNVTFCVFGLSPCVMTMLVASNVFCNAARTYVLQPPHVTPDIVKVYLVSAAREVIIVTMAKSLINVFIR